VGNCFEFEEVFQQRSIFSRVQFHRWLSTIPQFVSISNLPAASYQSIDPLSITFHLELPTDIFSSQQIPFLASINFRMFTEIHQNFSSAEATSVQYCRWNSCALMQLHVRWAFNLKVEHQHIIYYYNSLPFPHAYFFCGNGKLRKEWKTFFSLNK
jgi:hypothetical protein